MSRGCTAASELILLYEDYMGLTEIKGNKHEL